jgi:hypothetical protein
VEVDAMWRPWNHKVNHGSHRRKLNDIEEKVIEEALNERSARGEKIDRKLVQIVVRQITLETRGVRIDMCLSSMGNLMHRLGFTPRAAHVRRRHEADPHAEAAFQAAVDDILADPMFNPSNLINLNETAVRIHGGRNMTWAKRNADGVLIDSAGSPKDCFRVLAGCSFDGSLLPLCFVAKGRTARCRERFGDISPHWITHSEKEWITGKLLIQALREIRELPRLAGRAKMAVVIDQAPCHMAVDVAMAAAQLGMVLIPMPPAARAGTSPWTSASSACSTASRVSSTITPCVHAPGGPRPRQMRSA